MGLISDKETHVERSSSTTFAMRWKHENLRYVIIPAIFTCVIIMMFMVLMYGTASKRVYVVVDGKETVVETKQWELNRLLDEQAITLGTYDEISVPLDSKVKHGDRIVINFAKPFQLTADGKTETKYTTAKTVASALQQYQVTLDRDDKIVPNLDSELTSDTQVKIIRVDKVAHDVKEEIPFDTIKKDDAKLAKGKQEVVQAGKEGTLVKQFEKVYEDGVLVAENLLEEMVEQPSIDKVVAVGTKQEVTALSIKDKPDQPINKDDIKFTYKEILNNVQLTAYNADGGGKSKDDPYYGYTASGTKVTEGRTIAVDPKVIPLGWWVYIDGIGFRRAEDTGGAVKGKIIDIYYEDEDHVNKFGRKRGYTVYVIGPKKPVVD
jgi:uncharacterized protein YabE (DUF348 family)/3D (Asp-Asp-Asp) domain-containing protein